MTKKSDVMLTLNEHFQKCKEQLKPRDHLLGYYDKDKVYRVIYDGVHFRLFSKKERYNNKITWDSVVDEVATYDSIEDFFDNFMADQNWYKVYRPINFDFGKDKLIAKSIIDFHNDFVRKQFEVSDYKIIHNWMNFVYTNSINRSEYKQYCSNCKETVAYNARYPKYICEACVAKLTDNNGRQIVYYNTELMGHGCQGYYKNTIPIEKFNSNLGYIDSNVFYAQEAYFGGIVVQLKE